jgi:hypothetical protein
MTAKSLSPCCVFADAPHLDAMICGLPTGHDGPHVWDSLTAPVPGSRASLDPKSMTDVIAALHEVYGDDDDVVIALSHGKVAGGKYPGRTAIEVCSTAQGRYDVWAMARAMTVGVLAD